MKTHIFSEGMYIVILPMAKSSCDVTFLVVLQLDCSINESIDRDTIQTAVSHRGILRIREHFDLSDIEAFMKHCFDFVGLIFEVDGWSASAGEFDLCAKKPGRVLIVRGCIDTRTF